MGNQQSSTNNSDNNNNESTNSPHGKGNSNNGSNENTTRPIPINEGLGGGVNAAAVGVRAEQFQKKQPVDSVARPIVANDLNGVGIMAASSAESYPLAGTPFTTAVSYLDDSDKNIVGGVFMPSVLLSTGQELPSSGPGNKEVYLDRNPLLVGSSGGGKAQTPVAQIDPAIEQEAVSTAINPQSMPVGVSIDDAGLIATLVTWARGGSDVYVIGSFNKW